MARGRGGWGNRDTPDDSREYSRQFDPQGYQRHTNQLEADSEVRKQALRDRLKTKAEEDAIANSGPHYRDTWEDVGKFVIPTTPAGAPDNNLLTHAALVEGPELAFNPEKHLFDKILAERFPAIMKPENLEMQKNVALLRNHILGAYMQDGTFDPDDAVYVPKIKAVAVALGDALSNHAWYRRPFTRSFSNERANLAGVGAVEMYGFLENSQQKPNGLFNNLINNLKTLLGIPLNDWNLAPVNQTPFSPKNRPAALAANNQVTAPASHESVSPDIGPASPIADMSAQMAALGEGMAEAAQRLNAPRWQPVDTMGQPDKDQSVVEGRRILRFFKNLQSADVNVEDVLHRGEPDAQLALADMLNRLLKVYEAQRHAAWLADPEALAGDAATEQAARAASALAFAVNERSLGLFADDHPETKKLEARIDAMPDHAEALQQQSLRRLIEDIELGFNRAAGKQAAPGWEQWRELAERGEAVSEKLSVDSMAAPKRREAVDLMVEFLRNLKITSLSNRPVDELSNEDQPDRTLASAQQMLQFGDMYQNLVAQMAQENPELLKDPDIQEANNAIKQYVHSVKLMAAKEMPGSMSAGKNIGAEASRDAGDVDQLHAAAKERMVAAKGLEKAVSMAAQQQDEQAEDAAQDIQAANEQLQQAAEQQKRKRRRKSAKGGGSSGKASSRKALGGMAKRTRSGDLNGDGVDDRLQGGNARNAIKLSSKEDGKPAKQSAFMGLNPEALAAALKDGDILRGIGQQANNLPLASVSANDKIAPDDKTISQRVIETEQQKARNQGPGIA